MSVRIVSLNHTGLVSGAERSLLELLDGLPAEMATLLLCPAGPLAEMATAKGIPVTPLEEVDGSLRLHPLHTPRAITGIARAAQRVRAVARASGAEVVHANSIRAGLIAVAAHRLGAPPVVVHVRDCLPRSRAAALTRKLLCHEAATVLANSRYTAEAFTNDLAFHRVRVVANPVDAARFDPGRLDQADARQKLGLAPYVPLIGVVAQLSPWKGQDDAIRILARLRSAWPNAQLLIVGEAKFTRAATRFDNAAYAHMLHALVVDLDLDGSVHFLGEREDVPDILRALDVLLVPSWEEPFGRTVIECMATGTPVLATAVGGPAEIITDGETGLVLPPRDPARWAEAVDGLLRDPERRRNMGLSGRRRVLEDYTVQAHVDAMVQALSEAAAERHR